MTTPELAPTVEEMGHLRWCAAWLCLLALPVAGVAQRVYTWKDERGTIHFSDRRPAGVQGVEERSLEPESAMVGEAVTTATGKQAKREGEVARTPARQGPARVVVTEHAAKPAGPQGRRLEGTVKNVGGEVAKGVSLLARVVDAGQGGECALSEIAVEPGDIEPGHTGKYEDYIETPCFRGEARVDLKPVWHRVP